MFNKKLAAGVFVSAVLTAGIWYVFRDNEKPEIAVEPVLEEKQPQPAPVQVKKVLSKPVQNTVKADLYNSVDKNIPFSAIADLALMPECVKKTVNELLEESSGGIYFLKQSHDKVFLIVDLTPEGENNPIKRHDFHFLEISATDGSVLTQQSRENESKQDKWEFDNELPLSHVHYGEDKHPVYTEVWNYSEDEPVKYKKTDKDGQVISMRKEVIDNGVNLREEHLFYDGEGNMVKNVSFNYDGTDLTRFTYYNSKAPDDSAMLVSEFEDGVKKKETLYSSDYKIKNIYVPEYKDYKKSEIKILDKNNNVVETLQAE